ncbi:hypothetical protein PMPD1_2251 [Paramixta manurensis]|uniref:Uncharacterized protein n=1 Tax=Paramixta manurensis TaxID=2740817 RepID=A0A6M8U8U6_9GAMM|nr:hypothetical protein PMPD1_2251 [Erwiniaceae bacterium PD-1]
MGTYYYVNNTHSLKQPYTVHAAGCQHLPTLDQRLFLGTFYTPAAAVQQAQKYYPSASGCALCCPLPPGRVRHRRATVEQHKVAEI